MANQKTVIYKNYSEFLSRENKDLNGVDQNFANANPEYVKENKNNKACWNCSGCSRCSGCSDCSRCYDCSGCSRCSGCSDCSRCYDCSDCSDCYDCSDCSDCYDCSDCSDCSGCSDCYDCSDCSGCYDCSGCSDCSHIAHLYYKENLNATGEPNEENVMGNYPKIENIHQKVYEAASQPKALNMNTWHTCDTTHCRAGWVVNLAGEVGRKLELHTSTLFAAMQIYNVSSPIEVSPVNFFDDDKTALANMKEYAEKEKAQIV